MILLLCLLLAGVSAAGPASLLPDPGRTRIFGPASDQVGHLMLAGGARCAKTG
jgi:hypothetical protein